MHLYPQFNLFRLGMQHDLTLTKKVLEAKKEANENGTI